MQTRPAARALGRALSILPLFALSAFAVQTAYAEPLTGRVTDARGNVVPGAVVGDWLKGGPFAVTDAAGRYTLEMPGAQRVVGAWKNGHALSGPRWIDARARAASADFTLLESTPDILRGLTPAFSHERGRRRAMLDSTGVQATLWTAAPGEPVSPDTPARIAWTLDDATIEQVEVRWRTVPAAWHIEMTFTVTDQDGGNPRLDTRTYYRNGADPKHDNGNGWTDGERVTTSVLKTAPVVGVKSLALVITQGEGAVYSVTAHGPRRTDMADASAAMRIGLGLQDYPADPNAVFRLNAWNGDAAKDQALDARDAVTLINDQGREVKRLRVLTINYEPVIESQDGNLLRQVVAWNDPHPNTDEHVKDMHLASHRYLRIERLPEIEADDFPVLFNRRGEGQLQFTDETFLDAWRHGKWPSNEWGSDYNAIVQKYDLVRRVGVGDVEEVWIQGFPGLSMWETTMVGPNAYWCNSSPVPSPADSLNGTNGTRLFIITAFNYEREPDVMIHDWGHRTESMIGEKVYGTWYRNVRTEPKEAKTTWDKYSRIHKFFPGDASVGYCHYPANAEKDYDYANPTLVPSDADDWLNYPNLTGAKKMVNRDTWALPRVLKNGAPDYQRNYLIWMFARAPHVPGIAPDGKQANWWKYIADLNSYPESR